ncbi:hypothetical protein COCC4DRAFT_174349 [Bipolaris maydis ATCC 48331]|uniref:Beta-lactamase-related domain-containing protein n=2 Tax=Cochliobolus heterostrophus TaxID=5016 RepID=M2T3F1_COCH5|nr:uncharacterized protein COCC4DRAFT_174349 [Bipolaris maydis ATCC 48331]EMD92095.1 hypothetical protein COCHEDRAFT_1173658 [Bipolaris maydis C5]KAJ5021306.1 beta-lactamase/transpeptidase-like protein [Bipolaris maydis]ENI02422.1 hypothetical protein COCC4DRAFT_174349 [Bipolaris maydis ATCC 48331]KAJ6210697.1 beta-lactamase/transpeptidase-like protein [Bipolaris maydis]KAJ6271785.1 beta-lactamase/transpeptidase-like protein [Bipolaris maydis]
MADFEKAINDAIAAEEIPGCAVLATNRDGTFKYSKAFGKVSMKPENNKPMQLDTVMWIASCTKLMTSISAMQLVERGVISLDDPVYKHIPELESRTVIKGFTDAGAPIEEKHTKPITLRHLLSHSSGLGYEFINPVIEAWLKYHNRPSASSGSVSERFFYPLTFEPGESWAYGVGIDYAGLLIERATGQSLEDYMKANLWGPLGIKDMTFFPSKRPDLAARMADMTARDPASGKLVDFAAPLPVHDSEGKEVTSCFGGQGVYASMEEYAKVLKALLEADQGGEGKILKKESVEELFKAQLGDKSREALMAVLENKEAFNPMGGLPFGVPKDHTLAGIVLLDDGSNGYKAGTVIWGGYPNIIWWVDRKTGLCGIYGGQVVPPGDVKVGGLQLKFEAAMYERLAKERA